MFLGFALQVRQKNHVKLGFPYQLPAGHHKVDELYAELVTAHNKEVDVIVVSAYAMTKKQKEELSKSLEKRLARKVNLNCSIDKSLIAGMVITAGDLVIDSSAIGQLNRLSDTLQS